MSVIPPKSYQIMIWSKLKYILEPFFTDYFARKTSLFGIRTNLMWIMKRVECMNYFLLAIQTLWFNEISVFLNEMGNVNDLGKYSRNFC